MSAPGPKKVERWLSTGQVALKLGWDERTIRRRCESGHIPGAMRLGGEGQWRIPRAWLDGVIAAAKGGGVKRLAR